MSKTAIRGAILIASIALSLAARPGWAQIGGVMPLRTDPANLGIERAANRAMSTLADNETFSDPKLNAAIARKDYTYLLDVYGKKCHPASPQPDPGQDYSKSGTGVTNCRLLAELHWNGQGVPRDVTKAISYYQMAADGGDWPAVEFLVRIYFQGVDVPRDQAKALDELSHYVAIRGLSPRRLCAATIDLGAVYAYGTPPDGVDAAKAYQQCIDKTVWIPHKTVEEVVRARTLLANLYDDGKLVPADPGRAVKLYAEILDADVPAADKANAQLHLGQCLIDGRGVGKNVERGMALIRAAADAKNAEASFALYKIYVADTNGDAAQAAHYLAQAADLNVLEAQYLMGEKALQSTPPDLKEARSWLQSAALQGYVEAQVAMGELDLKYDPIPARGEPEAYMWFDLAAQNKNSRGAAARDALASKLSADAVAQAMATETELKAKFPAAVAAP